MKCLLSSRVKKNNQFNVSINLNKSVLKSGLLCTGHTLTSCILFDGDRKGFVLSRLGEIINICPASLRASVNIYDVIIAVLRNALEVLGNCAPGRTSGLFGKVVCCSLVLFSKFW